MVDHHAYLFGKKCLVFVRLGHQNFGFFIALQSDEICYTYSVVSSACLSIRENRLHTYRKSIPLEHPTIYKDIGRGILFALRSLFAELVILLGVGVISFFAPAISPLAVAFLFVVNCFYMGVSLMDYVAERRKLNVSESMNFMRENKWTVIGIGFMFNVFYMLPLLGIVLAPLNGAVGCVLAQHQLED